MFSRIPRRLTTATVALACFGGGVGVAAGIHEHRVSAAVADARETAAAVEASRASLESSYSQALTASSDASPVAADHQVADAVVELETVAVQASRTAERLKVDIETPDVASALEGKVEDEAGDSGDEKTSDHKTSEDETSAEASAEPSASPEPSASASSEASSSATPEESSDASSAAAAAAAIVDDAQVQDVLSGEVDDVDTIESTIDQLEQAAAALELQARLVAGQTAEVEQAAAVATLTSANQDLDAQLKGVESAIKANAALSDSLEGLVTNADALAELDAERATLSSMASSEIDRDDLDAVEDFRADLKDQAQVVVETEETAVASHQAWVKKENARRDSENEKRTATYDQAVAKAKAQLPAAYRKAVAAHQTGWSGAPSGTDYANGYIPSSQLCTLDFAPSYQLQCAAATALESANNAYRAETGSNLEIVSAYRSYSAQVATKASRGSYAATPGTSNHGWGMAVDFGSSSATWMRANGASYGWVHPLWARAAGSKPEAWHLEFVAPYVSASVDMPSKPDLLEHVSPAVGG